MSDKMTEQEIINYLKENKKKGVIFAFMPDDVQNWCNKHFSEHIFSIFVDDKWDNKREILCLKDTVYALSDDYEPFKHWQEFVVEDGGFFLAEGSNYLWWQWCRFLDMNGEKYNAFGGWLYPNDDDWCMIPMCYIDNQLCTYCNRDKKTTPAIPIKIRFWRYQK